MNDGARFWAMAGAANAFLAVAAGAFGAHGLRSRVSERMLEVFETGARYQMFHALGLLAVAWVASQREGVANAAGGAMLAGVVLFSGSLYAMALTGVTKLGMVTPLGGVGFLVGWVLFGRAVMALR
ncbi:MAG: DUF423 domain-containing protein [Myxococcaceae bacterium]|nr:MAG: DUF423 domain-containing protein [Myxococcaceae bacterium]